MKAKSSALILLVVLLTGCTAGADFIRPDLPQATRYTATPLSATTAASATAFGEAQQFQLGERPTAQWWYNLGSPRLDKLIEQALQHSPTLSAAQATLKQAQALYEAQAGSTLYPQIDASGGAQRQRMNPGAQGLTGNAREFSLYNASVGVHYRLDLAGGQQRALEALAARADYRQHQLHGAQLTLAANIATTAITRARLASQIKATQSIVSAMEEQLSITQARVRLGQAAPDEVLSLQTQLEKMRAGLPALLKQ